MNRIIRLAATTFALACLAVAAAAAPTVPPVAFITDLSGGVVVARAAGKRSTAASLGAALRPGDRIEIGAGGAATILFKDGNLLELPERTVFTVGARKAAEARGGDELMAGVFKSVTEGVVGGSRESGLVALAPARGRGGLDLILAPRQTDLLDDRPAFRWRAVAGASRYAIVVSSDTGSLWRRETADTALAYPADAPALRRGEDYAFELTVPGASGVLHRETSRFRVKPGSDAETIRRHLARIEISGSPRGRARDFLAGAYLADQGLFADAAERFQAVCAADPDDPGPRESLGRVYLAMGRNDEAAVEFERALALTRKP